jgi:RHS repeat-associated protein
VRPFPMFETRRMTPSQRWFRSRIVRAVQMGIALGGVATVYVLPSALAQTESPSVRARGGAAALISRTAHVLAPARAPSSRGEGMRLALSGSYSATVLADNPVGYWRLGESSGTSVADATGHGYTGTYVNSPTLGSPGLLTGDSDTAVVLDGASQRVNLPANVLSSTTGSYSVEAWIKTTDSDGYIYSARNAGTDGPTIDLYISGGLLYALEKDDNGFNPASVAGTQVVNDGAAHYVVLTRSSGGSLRLYLDGVYVNGGSGCCTGPTNLSLQTIGTEAKTNSGSPTSLLAGAVDEVATYNFALSATQVAAHYTAGAQAPTTGVSDGYSSAVLADGPFGYWRLGETSGVRAVDSSGHGLHGARRNGAPAGAAGILSSSSDRGQLLDGTSQWVALPENVLTSATGSYSVEAWIQTTDSAGYVYSARNAGTDGPTIDLYVSGGVLHALEKDNNGFNPASVTGTQVVNDGAPHYVVLTRTSSALLSLYVDGVLVGTGSGCCTGPTNLSLQRIGTEAKTNPTSATSLLAGTVDEVATYTFAISAAQILAHYQAGGGAWEPLPQTYGPPAQTYGPCDGGLDALNQSGCWGDVSTLLGAVTQQATDASMPAIGIPFNYSRSYTSANTNTGRLGAGWSDSYSAAIVFQTNGDALVQDENGQQVYFTKQPNGSYQAPKGGLATLTANGGGYLLANDDQTHLSFDSSGRLLSIKDRNNEGVALGYNGSGQLTSVTDSVGRVVQFTPNADGTVQKLTLPDGRNVSYGYTNGRLTTVTDLRGGITTYGYDANGLLATIKDQNQNTVETDHYTGGRVDSQTDALGKQTTFSWDASLQTETITDANGHAWKHMYRNNMLVETVDPLGDTTVYGYDSNDNLTSVQDPRGNVTTMTYDARHNILTQVAPAPLSYQQVWSYNSFNDPLTYQDGRGNTTQYGYDSTGNLTSKTLPDPDGSGPLTAPVIRYGRDPAGTGLLVSLTDPNNHTTNYGYDSQGNQTSITSPLGEQTTMAYDSTGRMTSRVDPRGNVTGCGCATAHTTTFGYDNANHLTSETDPGLPAKTSLYDPAGNLQKVTDQNGHFTMYGYDADERLASVTAPDQTSVTRYDYDPAGNLAHRTDPNNHITTYGYDNANRLQTFSLPPITSPSSVTPLWTYGYDANGNRTSILDPNGATTTNTYDVLNRLTQASYSGGAATPTITYSYDANGNRTQMVDGDGTATYSYDNDNRLTSLSRVHNSGGTDAFGFGYDSAGNTTSRTYPDGTVVTYAPDNDERLSSVSVGSSTTSYGYDPASNLTTKTTPDGYTETRTYDNANRLASITTKAGSTTLSTFTYTLDPAGNRTTVSGTSPALYTYDSRDRLTSVCFQTNTCRNRNDPYIAWTYDPVGNRKTEQRGVNGTITSYAYNEDDELLTAGATNYSYDHNGNQTQAGNRGFTYNAANQLASTTSGSTTDTYSYDGDGNRQTDTVGPTTTRNAWDTNNSLAQLAEECSGTCSTPANLIRRYTIGTDAIGNDTIGLTTPTGSFYYHYDGIGNIVNVTNAAGAKQWTYSYEPFGNPRTTTQNATGAPTNPLRFVGQYLDPTSLYNLRARQYDPSTGQFLETDPTLAGRTSPYESTYDYAGQDPTNQYDFSGQTCQWAGHIPLFGHWAKKECHKAASPFVTARDEVKAQAQAADANVAVASMGGNPSQVKPGGPVSGPMNSPSPTGQSGTHTASCLLGATGLILWTTGGTIETAELWEARSAGQAIGKTILSNRVGRAYSTAGSVALVGWGATGFCR